MRFAVAALLMLGAQPALCGEQFVSVGVGTLSCAKFAEAYKASPSWSDTLYFSWGQGYLSSLNESLWGLGAQWRDLNSLSYQQQTNIVRAYCADNPLKNYEDAVSNLYDQFTLMPAQKQ